MQVATVLFCVLIGFAASHSIPSVEDPEWMAYKLMCGKEYKDPCEEAKHYESFCEQREKIREHNKLSGSMQPFDGMPIKQGNWVKDTAAPIEILVETWQPPIRLVTTNYYQSPEADLPSVNHW